MNRWMLLLTAIFMAGMIAGANEEARAWIPACIAGGFFFFLAMKWLHEEREGPREVVVKLEDGGMYVIECDVPLSEELMAHMRFSLERFAPTCRFIILQPGMRIARDGTTG